MDAEDWLPWLGIGLFASLIVGIETMFRSRRTAEALRDLSEKVFLLEHRLLRLDERLQPAGGPMPAPDIPPPEIAAPQSPEPISQPELPAVEPAAAPQPPPVPTLPSGPVPSDGRRLEQLIVENWLVWLGGVALGFGGAVLGKLFVDFGLVLW